MPEELTCPECGYKTPFYTCLRCGATIKTTPSVEEDDERDNPGIDGSENISSQGTPKEFPASTPDREVEAEYKDFDGWLILLCLCFIAFNPLATVFNLIFSYIVTNPYFVGNPWLLYIYIFDRVLSLGLMLFGIYAGIALWKIWPNAIELAQKYLLGFLAYSILTSIIPFITALPSKLATLPIYSFTYFALWYSYLSKSRRVKATYEKLYSLHLRDKLRDILANTQNWLKGH